MQAIRLKHVDDPWKLSFQPLCRQDRCCPYKPQPQRCPRSVSLGHANAMLPCVVLDGCASTASSKALIVKLRIIAEDPIHHLNRPALLWDTEILLLDVWFSLCRKSKTAKIRKTKKIEIDEDTGNTIGAAGIVGVAVATAGFLFVNSSSVVYEPAPVSEVSDIIDHWRINQAVGPSWLLNWLISDPCTWTMAALTLHGQTAPNTRRVLQRMANAKKRLPVWPCR